MNLLARVAGFILVLSCFLITACIENSATITVTNDTDGTHVVKFDGHGSKTLAAYQVYEWDIDWETQPHEDTKHEFSVYVDGLYCTKYHVWDGDDDREFSTYYCVTYGSD
ncbi:MAG TPA: hypothetical protein PK926_08325 [Spirochaetota bacterium]|nr:hypothetical protein [Spirochaetota bacterium]HPI89054.1 hypothetical protein [Spirochaetota bacterium]HPR48653.1 hypothetical protein [Spirochaetota bacterium]